MRRDDLAARIDHTLLAPEATRARIEALADEAVRYRCAAACVHPSWVPVVAARLDGTGVATCSVIGFPSGASPTAIKAEEARLVRRAGATELDVVIHLGLLIGGEREAATADLAAVRQAAPDAVLKVIVESALLDDARLDAAVDIAVDAGADYVKTSTGFHPAGGAHLVDVGRIVDRLDGRARVKASGGIRTLADVDTMLAAGVDRLGMSATVAVLDSLG